MKTGFHPQCVEQASNQPLISFLLGEYNNYFCLFFLMEKKAERISGYSNSKREVIELGFRNLYSSQESSGEEREEFGEEMR